MHVYNVNGRPCTHAHTRICHSIFQEAEPTPLRKNSKDARNLEALKHRELVWEGWNGLKLKAHDTSLGQLKPTVFLCSSLPLLILLGYSRAE